MRILTADQQSAVQRAGGYLAFVKGMLQQRWGVPVILNLKQTQGEVPAEIQTSQWIVRCPHCPGAVVANPDGWFICTNCGNAGNNGAPMRVVAPQDRGEIERVLLQRPNPQTRNWRPGETVADLARENIEHGLGIP